MGFQQGMCWLQVGWLVEQRKIVWLVVPRFEVGAPTSWLYPGWLVCFMVGSTKVDQFLYGWLFQGLRLVHPHWLVVPRSPPQSPHGLKPTLQSRPKHVGGGRTISPHFQASQIQVQLPFDKSFFRARQTSRSGTKQLIHIYVISEKILFLADASNLCQQWITCFSLWRNQHFLQRVWAPV